MTFRNQFPAFPASDFPVLPVGFRDSSFGSDGQPSMTSDSARLFIMIDWVDENARAHEDGTERFLVFKTDDDGSVHDDCIFASDHWGDVLTFINARAA